MGNQRTTKYDKVTKEQVLNAIKGSYGIMLTIAKRLDCESRTAKKMIDRWEETRAAYEDEDQVILDISENQIYKSVLEGDIATAKWILSRKGKSRGWNEDNTLRLANGDPLNINLGGDMMTKEQIEAAGNLEIPSYDDTEGPAEE